MDASVRGVYRLLKLSILLTIGLGASMTLEFFESVAYNSGVYIDSRARSVYGLYSSRSL